MMSIRTRGTSGRATRIAVCVLLAVTSLAAPVSANGDHSGQGHSEVDVRFIVAEDELAELNMNMMAGGSIGWEVESLSGGPFYMDLHSHAGNEVENHEEFSSTEHESGTFTAPQDGGYSILIAREEPGDVEIRLQVVGAFEEAGMEGIEPLEDADGTEESGVSGVVALVALALMVRVADRRRKNAGA